MPDASSSALLGDIMFMTIQKVVETPGTTVLLGIQKSLQLSPEHRTLPRVIGMVISGIHFTTLCTSVICNVIIQPTPNTTKNIASLPTRLGITDIDHEVSTIMQSTCV